MFLLAALILWWRHDLAEIGAVDPVHRSRVLNACQTAMKTLHGSAVGLSLNDRSRVFARLQGAQRLWALDGALEFQGNVSVFSCEALETDDEVRVTALDSPQFFTPPPD